LARIIWELLNKAGKKKNVNELLIKYHIFEDSTINEEVASLLNKIKQKRNINFEIVEVKYPKNIREAFYKDEFLNHVGFLNRNVGSSIKTLKKLAEVTVIYEESIKKRIRPIYFDRQSIKFLQGILEGGKEHVHALIRKNRAIPKKEEKLFKEFFKRSSRFGFNGKIIEKFPLKLKEEIINASKEIDVLHENEDGTFDIIEIKEVLNWSSIGQVLGYKFWLSKLHHIKKEAISMHIVCKKKGIGIKEVCDHYGINLHVL